MRRPPAFMPRRITNGRRGIPENRTEAAIELVRVEFERQRLQRELDQCRRRAEIAEAGLKLHDARGRVLHRALAIREDAK